MGPSTWLSHSVSVNSETVSHRMPKSTHWVRRDTQDYHWSVALLHLCAIWSICTCVVIPHYLPFCEHFFQQCSLWCTKDTLDQWDSMDFNLQLYTE
ncbi:hypothetical protein FKM82_011187 [Ascaphus truei]